MELIARIEPTEFCLTYDLDTNIMYLRFYMGEEVGGIIGQARVTTSLDKLGPQSQPIRTLKSKVKSCNIEKIQALNFEYFKTKIDDSLMDLQNQWFTWLDGAEERAEDERLQKEQEEQAALEELISEGLDILDEMEHPLRVLAYHIDWLTAGERLNILYTYFAFGSQIILKNPISVIGIGDGGSGKTHIQDIVLSLIPEDYVMTIKSTTDAALFGFCDTDPHIFDGKIVNIGDMGGKNDHEEAQNFKNAIKEMQTDGKMVRVKREQNPDGKWENKYYELFGYPCLTYTNVPGYEYEDQEKSRSIFYQPRTDNDTAVSKYKRLYKQKGTPTSKLIEERIFKNIDFKKMLIALRHRMEYVSIENPYTSVMEKYLEKSRYFKRDVDKYDGILRVITAINGYKRPIINNTLFTTKDDIRILFDLISGYQDSIIENLTPTTARIYKELQDRVEELDLYESGVSVNQFTKHSKYSKSAVGTAFSELNTEGRLEVVRKDGRQNIYVLSNSALILSDAKIELDESDIAVLDFNYNLDEILEYLEADDSYFNLYSQNPDAPYWYKFLPEYEEAV